jgi:hypothetical protein
MNMSIFGRTVGGHFVLDDVNCTGNESNIFDCQYPTGSTPNCKVTNDEEAGVICGVTPGIYQYFRSLISVTDFDGIVITVTIHYSHRQECRLQLLYSYGTPAIA